jgi:hypothetical protein
MNKIKKFDIPHGVTTLGCSGLLPSRILPHPTQTWIELFNKSIVPTTPLSPTRATEFPLGTGSSNPWSVDEGRETANGMTEIRDGTTWTSLLSDGLAVVVFVVVDVIFATTSSGDVRGFGG